MKLRRVHRDGRLVVQQSTGGDWADTDDAGAFGGQVFDPEWELTLAREHLERSEHLLPFQPVSFRDFLLSERARPSSTRRAGSYAGSIQGSTGPRPSSRS